MNHPMIYDQRIWNAVRGIVLLNDTLFIIGNGKIISLLLHKRIHGFYVLHAIDAQDGYLRKIQRMNPSKCRHFPHAGSAPGGKEIQYHDTVIIIGQPELTAIHKGCGEIRCHVAHLKILHFSLSVIGISPIRKFLLF